MTSPDIPRCTARKSNGEPCSQRPIRGGTVCYTHGGSTPQVRAAANVRLLQAKVRGELVQRGWDPVSDPLQAYADLAGEVWAFKELCRERLEDLSRWETPEAFGKDETKAAVQVYERALERAQKTLHDMLRLGLDAEALRQSRERPTREQAEQLVMVLTGVLDDLGLSPEQRARVPQVIAAHVATVRGAA
jgi:hypothetical protein